MPKASKAVAASVVVSEPLRFLTFRLENRLYAFPSEFVAEIIHVPPAARIPQSPPSLLGVSNLRGTILPLASLRGLLGLAGEAAGPTARAIVLDIGAPIAVVVDAVNSLVEIQENHIEREEVALGAKAGERLTGAFRTGETQTVAKILDIKSLLDAAFTRRTAAKARENRLAAQPTGAAAESREAQNDSQLLVTFDIHGQEFAFDLSAVDEIMAVPEGFAAIPRSDDAIVGVTTAHDRLLPLLSLRALLGFPASDVELAREKVVVVKIGDHQVGLVADQARSVLSAQTSRIDAVPGLLSARTGGEAQIKAIYRGDGGRRLVSILSPDSLFREDVMKRVTAAATSQAAIGPADGQAKKDQAESRFLVFRLGNDEFGLPIEAVDEVTNVPQLITRVPKTPEFLEGVVSLRGDVLPVIDQRRRFDMDVSAQQEKRRLVVVRTKQHRAGLIVDDVSDVLRVVTESIEPAPDLTEESARLIRGVVNLDQRIVLILDPVELLTPAERGLLEAFQKNAQESQ